MPDGTATQRMLTAFEIWYVLVFNLYFMWCVCMIGIWHLCFVWCVGGIWHLAFCVSCSAQGQYRMGQQRNESQLLLRYGMYWYLTYISCGVCV